MYPMSNYLDIEAVSTGYEKKVRQSLEFKTGNFIWRVKFSTPLDPSSVNATTMYLSDEGGRALATRIRYDAENTTIEVAPKEPYAEEMSYYLNITTKVKSRGGQQLKSPIQVKFKL